MDDDPVSHVGIGANLGDPAATVNAAIERLAALPGVRLLARSSHWRSTPVDAAGPDYVNAVVALRAGMDARMLLRALQAIEHDFGRLRPYRNAPRTLDLDLLLHGDAVIHEPDLEVPHPRMHLRAFVLAPLVEIAPELTIPRRGPAADWLRRCAGQSVEKLAS